MAWDGSCWSRGHIIPIGPIWGRYQWCWSEPKISFGSFDIFAAFFLQPTYARSGALSGACQGHLERWKAAELPKLISFKLKMLSKSSLGTVTGTVNGPLRVSNWTQELSGSFLLSPRGSELEWLRAPRGSYPMSLNPERFWENRLPWSSTFGACHLSHGSLGEEGGGATSQLLDNIRFSWPEPTCS